ncbi:MAG: hypothetical protein ACFFBD_13115, partial [Candidatus Hodarchaeota archaeon]
WLYKYGYQEASYKLNPQGLGRYRYFHPLIERLAILLVKFIFQEAILLVKPKLRSRFKKLLQQRSKRLMHAFFPFEAVKLHP